MDWAQAKRRVLVFLSAPFVRGESAARILANGDGDHAIATRVLGYLLPSADDHPSDDEDEDDSDSDEDEDDSDSDEDEDDSDPDEDF